MKKVFFVVGMSVIVVVMGCKNIEKKERWEHFGGGHYTEWIKGNKDDPEGEYISYHINVDSTKREIDFYVENTAELAIDPHYGIRFGRYVVDRTNKTISIYRERDGALIITVKFISDTEFRIIEYGGWLDPKSPAPEDEIKPGMSDKEKEELKNEGEVKCRFIRVYITDTNRVYSMD